MDRVVAHHGEKDTAEREGAEEEEMVEVGPQSLQVRHDTRER